MVDELRACLSVNGIDPDRVEEALLRIQTMRRHPPESFALGVPTLIETLAHWDRVTGGDEVTHALGRWLDTMDPKTTAGVDARLLDQVRLHCPVLIPFAPAPQVNADPRFDAYAEALCVALAESAKFASVDVWKSTVVNMFQQVTEKTGNFPRTSLPHVLSQVAQARTPFGQDNAVREVEKVVSEAHFTPEVWEQLGSANSFMDGFSVYQERTLVAHVEDASREVAQDDRRLRDQYDLQVGEELSIVDEDLTDALRMALIRTIGA